METNYKRIGYISAIFLLLLILLSGYLLWAANRHHSNQIKVEFAEVGTLKPQNVVFHDGIPIGQVSNITRENGKTLVILDFEEPIKLCEGSVIYNRNFSLVGERIVAMKIVTEGKPIDLSQPIRGVYEPGFSESLHLVGKAVDLVIQLQSTLFGLTTTTDSSKAFHQSFAGIIAGTKQILNTLDVFVDQADPMLKSLLNEVQTLGNNTVDLAESMEDHLKSFTSETATAMHSVQSGMEGFGFLLEATQDQLIALQNHKLYKDHLESKKLLEDVEKALEKTVYILTAIRSGGANLPPSENSILGLKNFHFLGRAADKRKAKEAAP